ncbi:MBL fold metallo-hydrolase [Pseudoalteromonas luteoviolacea]|uniref:MBL fold metallo-hydrolase n=1 Tax=Pseudoalteromonas luteoviolacea TaxID=43657 RepID=UPI0031BB229E|nr:MBL fold metallo-hydrolase [Pseudoalteromonas luteoviolacea]
MKKIKLDEGLYQYQFPPFENQHFGFNIYALIQDDEALLIDTAFEEQAQAVIDDLANTGIQVKKVVFSHFHPDHISGLPVLNSPELYGSYLYKSTLEKYIPKERHHYFEGVNLITDGNALSFGAFRLTFKLIQGHVICGMYTIINDAYIHVADDVMTSNGGLPLLPSVQVGNAQKHANSLELLKNYASYTLLPSHGNAFKGSADILQAIQDRQSYLRAIADSDEPITVEKALKNVKCDFLHKEWHDYVYS